MHRGLDRLRACTRWMYLVDGRTAQRLLCNAGPGSDLSDRQAEFDISMSREAGTDPQAVPSPIAQ